MQIWTVQASRSADGVPHRSIARSLSHATRPPARFAGHVGGREVAVLKATLIGTLPEDAQRIPIEGDDLADSRGHHRNPRSSTSDPS
jgi:hypothetical protein